MFFSEVSLLSCIHFGGQRSLWPHLLAHDWFARCDDVSPSSTGWKSPAPQCNALPGARVSSVFWYSVLLIDGPWCCCDSDRIGDWSPGEEEHLSRLFPQRVPWWRSNGGLMLWDVERTRACVWMVRSIWRRDVWCFNGGKTSPLVGWGLHQSNASE